MNKRETSKPKTTSWMLVVAMLVGFPFLGALAMRLWLGVPTEYHENDQIFSRLEVPATRLSEAESLQFGKMFFCRLRVEQESLDEFLASIDSFEQSEGKPETPISFDLERAWWDVERGAEGQYWKRGTVVLWSPQKDPGLFYGVVSGQTSGEGDEVEATKSLE